MSVGFSRDRWTEYIRKKVAKGDYSAIVMTQETDVWAENKYGETIAEGEAGVDDAEVIQKALDNLTSGRTWKERVILIGNFTIRAPIIARSYTELNVFGKLKLADAVNDAIIKVDTDQPLEHFELIGGYFDGNGANQTDTPETAVIYLNPQYLSNVIVKKVTVINALRHGIKFAEQSGGTTYYKEISNCYVYNVAVKATGYGIYCDYAPHTRIIGNYVETVQTVDGIEMGHGGNYICKYNILIGNDEAGSQLQFPYADNSVIEGNVCYKTIISNDTNTANNVRIKNNIILQAPVPNFYGAIRAKGDNIVIDGNYIEVSNNQRGIHPTGNYVRITNNTIVNVSGEVQGTGIMKDAGDYYIIQNNRVVDFSYGMNIVRDYGIVENNIIENADQGIRIPPYSSSGRKVSYVRIIKNTFVNCTTTIYLGTGGYDITTLRIFDNEPDTVTMKNSGTATFSGDGSTTQFKIEHGLASTPSKVLVTPMTADAAGDFYVTADDTYIYINYKTAPPSGTDNVKVSWYAEV